MNVFNAWYYSFSPSVANYERHQPWAQEIIKKSIYPLLWTLLISEKVYSSIPGEYGAVTAGLVASSMIGAIYFSVFALLIKQIREGRINYRYTSCVYAIVLVATIASVIIGNHFAMMVTTSIFVLTALSFSAILFARIIVAFVRKITAKIIC